MRTALLAPLVVVVFGLAAAQGAHAAERECRNGVFPREQDAFGLARVVGAERLVFLGDNDGCPGPAPACTSRSYVTPGDVLITGRNLGPYVCAYYPNKGGGTVGWVARDRLAPSPVAASPPLSAWAGRWREYDDELRLKVRGGRIAAAGDAYWPSANPSPRERPVGPNIGDIEAEAAPRGARLHLSEGAGDACAADLWLVGPYLVVRDNMNCGGMNVSFTGVYRRR